MGFVDSINSKKFNVLAEIDPPKGIETAKMFETADMLKGRVDAIILNDMPSAVLTMGSLAASFLLKEKGIDTIFNILCRDRNILALQSDILSAAALGIENLYINVGDDISYGDHPQARPVNEIDDTRLLTIVSQLQEGSDAAGNRINGNPRFNIGVAINSGATGADLDKEFKAMEEKAKTGASYFISSPVFDLKAFEEFTETARKAVSVPIIAEVLVLKSVATARYINKHVNGINVPDEYVDRLYSAGDKQKESITITAELIRGLKEICEGVNIKAMGWEEKIPAYLDAAEA
jgi:5,10-methylenetetrahydrofolate reductase